MCGQALDAKNAKILKEQRFDAGDGRFGAAFAQEDGTVFREETTADGERIGQYSYIDQDGQTITVRYSAGKDGFRILEGAHIPEGATGLQSAPFDPAFAEVEAEALPPQPQQVEARPAAARRPQPRPAPQQPRPAPALQQLPAADFNPFINPADPTHRDLQRNTNAAQFRPQPQQQLPEQPRQQQQQFQQQPRPQTQQLPAADFNPFINPADPTHQDFQRNTNAAQFRPQPQQVARQPQQFQQQAVRQQAVPSAASVPACANCEGFNPFINPADSSHTQLFQQQQFQQQPRQQFQQQPSFRQPASTFPTQQQQQFQQQAPNPAFSFQQRTQVQQQPSQQPLQPAFATPTLRQPQQAPPTFSQASTSSFQGNLNLNRFDSGFNFEFST